MKKSETFRKLPITLTSIPAALCALALMALVMFTAHPAQAALLAYEPFTNSVDGTPVYGSAGGFGWATNWHQAVATGQGYFTNKGLTYTDGAGKQLVTVGGSAFFQGLTTANSQQEAFRNFNFVRGSTNITAVDLSSITNSDGGNTWVSFLIVRQGPTGTAAGNLYGRGANVCHDFASNSVATPGKVQKLSVGGGSGAPADTISLLPAGGNRKGGTTTFGLLTNFVVVKIEHVAGAAVFDNAYLFVNPLLSTEPLNSAAQTNELAVRDFTFDRLRVFVGGNASVAQPYAEIFLDEYRVGETYADVAPIACQSASISVQPTNVTVFENTAATFSYTPSGTAPTNQWQLSTDSGSTWNNITDATNTSYVSNSIPLAANGNQFRVISYVPCDSTSITSSPVTLTVNSCTGAGVSVDPTNLTVLAGSVADFYVTGTGSSPTYQWQVSTNGGANWDNVTNGTGGTTTHYTTIAAPSGFNGYKYRAVVSVSCNASSANSAAATLTVASTPPVISSTTVSGGNIIISGSGATNGSYYVLTATNITLPLSNWTHLATNQIDGAGQFSFTNAIESGVPVLFYQLLLP